MAIRAPSICVDAGGAIVSTCTVDALSQTCAAIFPAYSQTLSDCVANQ